MSVSALSPVARRLPCRLWKQPCCNLLHGSTRVQARRRLFSSTSLNKTTTKSTTQPSTASSASSSSAPSSTKPSSSSWRNIQSITLIASAASLFLAFSLLHAPPTQCDSPAQPPDSQHHGRDPNLPRIRIAEVRKHDGRSAHPWVIYGDRVYDITDWIAGHPGGEVILRAAGGSIEPYWDIFSIHKTQYIYDILGQFLIGYVDPADLIDGRPTREEIEDPFSDDPERHPALITMTAKPRNAETPTDVMTAAFLTPNDLFYVRNHMWVPTIPDDPDQYTLTVELEDGAVREYTLRDLKTRFAAHKVTAVLQCSGNRRRHMSEGSGRKANGLPWNVGAISNASWEGVLLSDVLADAGFDVAKGIAGTSEAKHVQFSGLEAYGASIPIKKAIDPQGDVLLAYSMNGQPLPRDHGFPLRAVVPGHVAARSVKWLSHISLSDEESTSQWQRRDYKCFGPNQTHVDWETAPAIQEMPVQSAITGCRLGGWTKLTSQNSQGNPSETTKTSEATNAKARYAQHAALSGYAYSGGGRAIVRVDVSLDGGKTWSQAKILPDCTTHDGTASPCFGHGSWAWRRWRYDGLVPLDAFDKVQKSDKGNGDKDNASSTALLPYSNHHLSATFVVKATDEAYNTQPESHSATWNLRGNLATAWHRVQVRSDNPPTAGGETYPEDPYEGWENI
ncbi:Oxidoreductase, molybdopterin-binding domain-containing protein [Dactylonectria estremocensis]|uniref:Nitrate reductase [NADPH] n=1 Tax=Dactylonectria estremocensis TaxID=1079267 RepID=A0A9P9J3N3_9HYPO|nr:Oxidoreductase, molybdopterin-binding domain-containing protein [Dactylonectria estremocensis]